MNELPGLEKGETSFAIYSCRSSLPPALSSVVPVWGGQHPTKPALPPWLHQGGARSRVLDDGGASLNPVDSLGRGRVGRSGVWLEEGCS